MTIPGSTYHPAVAPDKAAQKRTRERAEGAWNAYGRARQMNIEQAIAEAEQAECYAAWAADGEPTPPGLSDAEPPAA